LNANLLKNENKGFLTDNKKVNIQILFGKEINNIGI